MFLNENHTQKEMSAGQAAVTTFAVTFVVSFFLLIALVSEWLDKDMLPSTLIQIVKCDIFDDEWEGSIVYSSKIDAIFNVQIDVENYNKTISTKPGKFQVDCSCANCCIEFLNVTNGFFVKLKSDNTEFVRARINQHHKDKPEESVSPILIGCFVSFFVLTYIFCGLTWYFARREGLTATKDEHMPLRS